MADGNKPMKKFRIGFVSATIWRNGDFYNVEVSKSYKEGDEWKDTSSLGHGDVLNAAKALERAERWISEQK